MANYPTTPTLQYQPSVSSTEQIIDDLQTDRASNGALRGRALFTAPKRAFKIVHDAVTATDKATLVDFYNTNRKLAFTFTWTATGAVYTCYFTAPPELKLISGGRWTVAMTFVEA